MQVEIDRSAHRHGVGDEDIRHAITHMVRLLDPGHDRILVIGPARDATLLEVVILDPDTDPLVIHAMPLRPKFHGFLR